MAPLGWGRVVLSGIAFLTLFLASTLSSSGEQQTSNSNSPQQSLVTQSGDSWFFTVIADDYLSNGSNGFQGAAPRLSTFCLENKRSKPCLEPNAQTQLQGLKAGRITDLNLTTANQVGDGGNSYDGTYDWWSPFDSPANYWKTDFCQGISDDAGLVVEAASGSQIGNLEVVSCELVPLTQYSRDAYREGRRTLENELAEAKSSGYTPELLREHNFGSDAVFALVLKCKARLFTDFKSPIRISYGTEEDGYAFFQFDPDSITQNVVVNFIASENRTSSMMKDFEAAVS